MGPCPVDPDCSADSDAFVWALKRRRSSAVL